MHMPLSVLQKLSTKNHPQKASEQHVPKTRVRTTGTETDNVKRTTGTETDNVKVKKSNIYPIFTVIISNFCCDTAELILLDFQLGFPPKRVKCSS